MCIGIGLDVVGVRGRCEGGHIYFLLELFILKDPDDLWLLFANQVRYMCV